MVGAGGDNGGGVICVCEWSRVEEQGEGWGSGGSNLESNPLRHLQRILLGSVCSNHLPVCKMDINTACVL